jgi:hypothetical protein
MLFIFKVNEMHESFPDVGKNVVRNFISKIAGAIRDRKVTFSVQTNQLQHFEILFE